MNETLPTVTTKEACQLLSVSPDTLQRWIKSGKLQAVRIGSRYRTTHEWINQIVTPVVAGDAADRRIRPEKGRNRDSDREAAERLLEIELSY